MKKEAIKTLLEKLNCNCLLIKDNEVIMSSFEKGVSPLYNFIKENESFPSDMIVGDRIIGRAVALLCVYLKTSYVYTKIISESAIEIFRHYDIDFDYDEVVPYIQNRKKDGQCPMEKALENIMDSKKAFTIIDSFIKNRQSKEDKK